MQRLWRLSEVRTRALLTQQALAEISGVGRSTIADLERGARNANPITAQKLANALDVEPSDLVEGASPKVEAGAAGPRSRPELQPATEQPEERRLVRVHGIRLTSTGLEFLGPDDEVIAVDQQATDLQFPGAVGQVLRLGNPAEMIVSGAPSEAA